MQEDDEILSEIGTQFQQKSGCFTHVDNLLKP